MRRSLLAAAALAAVSFPVPASAASPASAATPCVATADVPQPIGGQMMGAGRFTCATPRPGMSVVVCVEALDPARGGWVAEACATRTAAGSVTQVEDAAFACIQRQTLVRTTATGTNAAGDSATATSVPSLAPGVGSCGP